MQPHTELKPDLKPDHQARVAAGAPTSGHFMVLRTGLGRGLPSGLGSGLGSDGAVKFPIARVSLNGAVMDFAACTDSKCDDGFGFESSGQFGIPAAALLPSFGNLDIIDYSPGDWTMSVVPEPDTWALMARGLRGVALARRSR